MCVSKTYTLVLRSVDKISGTNSNANYLINWERLLPPEYQEFNVKITFMTSLFIFSGSTDPPAIETRFFMGKTLSQDTNNIDSLVHHSRVSTPLNTTTNNVWYESLDKDHIYSIQRPQNNVINVRNYSFETVNTNSASNNTLNLTGGGEIGYVVSIEFTPIK